MKEDGTVVLVGEEEHDIQGWFKLFIFYITSF